MLNGDICAVNLVTASGTLPVNIQIRGGFGQNGTICGTRVCPELLLTADPTGIDKSRFISFVPPPLDGNAYAIRVKLTSLHHPDPPDAVDFSRCEGQTRWVCPPVQYVESASSGTPFWAASLYKGAGFCCGGSSDGSACTSDDDCPGGGRCGGGPFYSANWGTYGLIHVTGSAIVPSSVYTVELVPAAGAACASSLTVRTTRWGDVVAPYNPPATSTQPDFDDISALVNKFKSVLGAPIKARAMLYGVDALGGLIEISPDVGFNHISACVDAFKGMPYPFSIQNCP